MTVTDIDENIWVYQGNGMLLRYDPYADTYETFETGITTYDYETRLGYDHPTHSIYFGGFGASNLQRYDITSGVTTELTSHPESQLNDIFCSDRSGHLYAAGGSGGTTLWQYVIDTDSWREITPHPVDHGNNGSCTVSEEGYLYIEPGDLSTIYRLPLY